MGSNGTDSDPPHGTFSVDSTPPGSASHGFDAFRRGWETQVGDRFPLSNYSPGTVGDFRVRARLRRVGDLATTDIHTASAIQQIDGVADWTQLCVLTRGAWTVGDRSGRHEHTVPAGQFMLRHQDRQVPWEMAPDTTIKIVILPPTSTLEPLLGNRIVRGPADAAEIRLLAAHTNMLHSTVADLGPAGVHAARNALLELVKAVALGRFDDAEPQLTPTLVQAAKDLADRRLSDPELSPTVLARALNVSVRTLHRAFETAGESITAYIRSRRLDEARLALTAPGNPLTISELAAFWQFADSSHFAKAFKKAYGSSPSEYARAIRSNGL
ncbi:helix-turn-helix domain-containing protein [Nocardia sp. NPDC024068]|uniref:helix-turn-helix domain-containing protein n=1 Tax=Nocardia sp. NPDC024068 TaxID=3157197 RepID=UPI00340E1D2A